MYKLINTTTSINLIFVLLKSEVDAKPRCSIAANACKPLGICGKYKHRKAQDTYLGSRPTQYAYLGSTLTQEVHLPSVPTQNTYLGSIAIATQYTYLEYVPRQYTYLYDMIGMPIFQMALFHSGLVYYLAVAKHNLIQNVIEIVLLFLSFLLFAHFLRIRFYFRYVHVT